MNTILELKNISKSFGPVKVLEGIDMTIEPGKVYVLAGENGAGKSTLCNIISGSLEPSGGSIIFGGKEHSRLTIDEAKNEIGVRMVHQELQVIPMMTIMENVFIGNEIQKHGIVDKKEMNRQTSELLKRVRLNLPPDTLLKDIEISGRQMVEIARAINGKANLIILDEPTSSLSQAENESLFEIIRNLKATGISFIFISHRLEEAFAIGDEILVLKDGKKVVTLDAKKTNADEIIRYMVGRTYDDYYNRVRSCHGAEVLRVENICATKEAHSNAYAPRNVSFHVEAGEVLGISGLVGAGRTELIRAIFGDMKRDAGDVLIDGKKVQIHDSADALKYGMAWVTEDRKAQGVILSANLADNISLVVLRSLAGRLFINDKKVAELADSYIDKLRIKAFDREQLVGELSGGNQQKVVLAKWLASKPRILVLDEPTRGIDVGAKAEIYKLINQLTAEGIAVIMISSELPEVMGMSDRIIVMYEGRITGELTRDAFNEETIMKFATGRSVSK